MKKSLILSALLVAGCSTVMTGSSGTLELSYTHGGLFESTANPIGSGLLADVVIRGAGEEESLIIDAAETDDLSILTVASIDATSMSLLAGSAGESTLSVTAAGMSDDFSITVEEIVSVSYGAPLHGEDDAVIAAGASLWVPRTVSGTSGSSLTGYGLAMPEIAPEDGAVGIEDGAIGSTLVAFGSPGEVLLSYAGGEATSYTVVAAEGVSWSIDDGVEEGGTLLPESAIVLILEGVDTEGGTVLGSLSSADPSVCTVESLLGSPELYTLSTLTEGTCDVFLNGDTAAPFLSYEVVTE